MEKFLMGIDIGTSACKVAVFNTDGNVLAQSTYGYNVFYPDYGFAEQNPLEWWKAVCIAVKNIFDSGKVHSGHIAGIGVSGQGWSAIPVDNEGNVLYNTPIWMDTRASDICKEVTEKIGNGRIFEVSGNPFKPTYSTPKILWFKKYKPEVFKETSKFLQSNSYIIFKLTGIMTQDISQGYGLHFFDIKTGEYDTGLCDELGVPGEMIPSIYACHQIVGEVTGEAARATGIRAGTPVVAGGLDAACGTLGTGVLESGQTQEQGGQAGGMSICMDRVRAHPKLILGYHVVPNLWLLQGGTVGGGGSLKWFGREFSKGLGRELSKEFGAFEAGQKKKSYISIFELMDNEASKINPGSDGLIFLPYMAGERSPIWDENALGVFFGVEYNKTRAHMIRSVMEGCAYALFHNIKTAEETGVKINVLNAMGGAANSRLWTQIKADVTGKIIDVPFTDTATTLGAAILAGVGTGAYKDFNEAVNRTIKIERTHSPDTKNHPIYMEYFEIYLEIYEKLKNTMSKCKGLMKKVK